MISSFPTKKEVDLYVADMGSFIVVVDVIVAKEWETLVNVIRLYAKGGVFDAIILPTYGCN